MASYQFKKDFMKVGQQLIDIASRGNMAELYYRKSAVSDNLQCRLVEPYNFTQGKQDVMIRCYQIEPESGWRFFMLHRIDRVVDSMRPFTPRGRSRVTLKTAEVEMRSEQASYWTDELQEYRDLVSDSLADGSVTPEEFKIIESIKNERGITIEQMRFVHASIFHRCLGAIIEDGEVEESEMKQIHFVHRVLSALGWGICEVAK